MRNIEVRLKALT